MHSFGGANKHLLEEKSFKLRSDTRTSRCSEKRLLRRKRKPNWKKWGRSGPPSRIDEVREIRFGEVLRKEQNGSTAKSLHSSLATQSSMKQMVKSVPNAGSYAPVTVLIDERIDGVHLSYDRMASSLSPSQDHLLSIPGGLPTGRHAGMAICGPVSVT